MISIVLHVRNEDAIACEIEELPGPQAQILVIYNPRRRDGKDVHYLDEDVTKVIYPMHRISFIQILPSIDEEEVIGFVRE